MFREGHSGVIKLPDEDAVAVDVAPPVHVQGKSMTGKGPVRMTRGVNMIV